MKGDEEKRKGCKKMPRQNQEEEKERKEMEETMTSGNEEGKERQKQEDERGNRGGSRKMEGKKLEIRQREHQNTFPTDLRISFGILLIFIGATFPPHLFTRSRHR